MINLTTNIKHTVIPANISHINKIGQSRTITPRIELSS